MRRVFWIRPRRVKTPADIWFLPDHQYRQLLDLLSRIGLHIVDEARGPVPLLTFGRRVLEYLDGGGSGSVPLPHFADALKRIIRDMGHDRLKVMSPTDFVGVGYVYNAEDPETWPIRSTLTI